MKKVLNKNNLIFILILMTLFNLMMPNISYAANISINDVLKETVAGWYMVLRGLGIGAMIILLLVLAGKAAISRNSGDSALVKRMLLDWLVGLLLIIFIHYFMIFAINLNEDMVKGSEKLGQSLSGMKEGQEISLYESVISKAYEIKFKPGTIGMVLYIMLVYYAYKFALVYLKRYVNVLVLILIAPIVCLMYAFKKVLSGKAITLKKWFKEFIYNVFLQSLHAVMYGTLVGLTLKYSNDGESFIGAIICMILFGVIFKVDKLVRKFFNSVGGDTSVAVSKIDSAFSNTKKAVGTFASGNAQAGATALMYGSKSDEFQNMKSKFGENLNWNKVADTFKGDSKNAWLDIKGGASDFYKGNKEGITEAFEDMKGTINGDHKYVSQEAIDKEQERLDNAGFFGKTWRSLVALPGTVKEKLPKKIEELRQHLENKKKETIQNIQDLRRDVETIRAIPQMIRDIKKIPQAAQTPEIVGGVVEYDNKYDALIDFDIDKREIEERITTFIEMSSGEISSAVILAMGYESIIRCPKVGMMMLAEDNYKNMIHPEIPLERRRMIAGVKHETKPFTFKNFGNGSIDTIQRVVMSDVTRNFAGVSTMQRVAKGIMEQRITLHAVPEGAEKFTVTYSGKKNAVRNMYEKRELVFERMHAFMNDINIAKNINIINNLEALRTQGKLSNLSPEMLEMLKNAGVIIEVKENGKSEGGYIILDNAIENAVMRTRVGHYVTQNAGTEIANRINKFLNANADSELAIRISNYIIDNPESTLATVIDRIQITDDGRIITKVDSFQMSENQPNLSQLGIVTDQGIVQKILTADGREVEQIIDLQGRIIKEATDENGNIVEFPVEQGRRLQTVMTPDGTMILQVVSQDGSSIMPLVLNENSEAKTEVVNMDTIETTDGIFTEVTPPVGEIQIVNRITGEVEAIRPENVTLQLVRNEDGELQIIKVETQEVVDVGEDTILQVIKPEEGLVQILDQESNTIETAYGEVAVQVLKDKGIILTPEEEAEFIAREELKAKLTALSDATAINLATGETENIIQLSFETEVLTALVAETVEKPAEVTTVEEHLDKMNNLFEQIGVLQSQELTENLLEELDIERELVFTEIGTEKAKVFEQLAATGEMSSNDMTLDDLVSSISVENVVSQANDFADDESDSFSDIYNILMESDSTSTSTSKIEDVIDIVPETSETTSTFDSLYEMISETPADKKVDAAVSAITAVETVVEDTSSTSDSFSKLYDQLTGNKEVVRTPGVKQTKKQTTTSENEKVNLVVEVKGAVINPCKIEEVVLKVTTVDDIVRKYCGGLSENINRDKYKDIAKKQVRVYNGKVLQIPEMTKQEIADKKKKQKENKVEHKITIYLSGNGSDIYGEKVIEENSKLYDIRTLFSREANKEAIRVNDRIVSLSYVLKDGDEVYVPLMTSNEKDTRRGINAGFIEIVIKNFITDYIRKNRLKPQYSGKSELEILQIILETIGLMKNINKSILDELKTKHNIEIPAEELAERVKKYIETEVEKLEKEMPRKVVSKKDKKSSRDGEIVQVTAIDPNLIRQLNFVGSRRVTVRKQTELFENSSRNRMDLTGNDRKDERIAEIEGYFRTRRDKLIASK